MPQLSTFHSQLSASPAALPHNPALSLWLSVDPLSDKYPGVSSYTYCANNPVRLVDVDGEDIWTIHEDGTIDRQRNNKIDRIDVISSSGTTIKGSETKYGNIKQHTISHNNNKIDYFEIRGDDIAKEAFENIADNTTIEWTHAKIGEEKSNSNILGTSHNERSTSIGRFLLETGYTLKEVSHNHPSGIPMPSGLNIGARTGDIPIARDYEEKFPNIKLNIYVNGNTMYDKGYYQYNSTGPLWAPTIKPN